MWTQITADIDIDGAISWEEVGATDQAIITAWQAGLSRRPEPKRWHIAIDEPCIFVLSFSYPADDGPAGGRLIICVKVP